MKAEQGYLVFTVTSAKREEGLNLQCFAATSEESGAALRANLKAWRERNGMRRLDVGRDGREREGEV